MNVFAKCIPLLNDEFWITVFDDLSKGKYPYGVTFSEKTSSLRCNLREKEFIYTISPFDSIEKIKTDIYNLFTKKLNMFSAKDKIENKTNFNDHERDITLSEKDWKKISKNSKNIHYETYVTDMKHKYNLSTKQCKYLLALITTMINFKMITNNNIVFENSQISEIEGISFVYEKGAWKIQRPEYNFSKEMIIRPPATPRQKEKLLPLWKKYLETV